MCVCKAEEADKNKQPLISTFAHIPPTHSLTHTHTHSLTHTYTHTDLAEPSTQTTHTQ